jgi:hypothetical protein
MLAEQRRDDMIDAPWHSGLLCMRATDLLGGSYSLDQIKAVFLNGLRFDLSIKRPDGYLATRYQCIRCF